MPVPSNSRDSETGDAVRLVDCARLPWVAIRPPTPISIIPSIANGASAQTIGPSPIEASSPAEAVRQFWSHVLELGPAELPTYVWPSGDELAMQAFVLGAEANQDPEEEDED